MPSVPFSSPTDRVCLSPWARLKAWLQIATERALPPRWLFALSMQAARAKLALNPKRRRRLEGVLGPLAQAGTPLKELRRQIALSRAVRQHGMRSFGPVVGRPSQWLLREFRPKGLEHLEAVKRSGSGAILVHSHIGQTAWEGPVLWGLGYPVKLVQRRVISPKVYVLLQRAGLLGEVLPYPATGEEGLHLKRLLDLVRQGVWLQHIGDVADRGNGLRGVFLNQPVQYVRAPWVLARLSGAPVIPTLMPADAKCRFRLFIGEPIHVGAGRNALNAAFLRYLDFLERHTAGAPWNIQVSQWEIVLREMSGFAKP